MRPAQRIALSVVGALAVVTLLVVVAIQVLGDDTGTTVRAAGDTGAADEGSDAAEAARDDSPFCVAVRSLEALGAEPAEGAGTTDDVLAQNAEVSALVEEAAASAPADAPPDVHVLFDDYRLLSDAIEAAAGDADAAFAALSANEPELMARFAAAGAHLEAFTFFSQRCGTAAP